LGGRVPPVPRPRGIYATDCNDPPWYNFCKCCLKLLSEEAQSASICNIQYINMIN